MNTLQQNNLWKIYSLACLVTQKGSFFTDVPTAFGLLTITLLKLLSRSGQCFLNLVCLFSYVGALLFFPASNLGLYQIQSREKKGEKVEERSTKYRSVIIDSKVIICRTVTKLIATAQRSVQDR